MKELTVYSLLRTDDIAHNKSKLSKLLNVTRTTIFKYSKDKAGLLHEVRLKNGKYELMANLTR